MLTGRPTACLLCLGRMREREGEREREREREHNLAPREGISVVDVCGQPVEFINPKVQTKPGRVILFSDMFCYTIGCLYQMSARHGTR